MFQGLRTAIYPTTDLARALAWYTDILGFPPYFNEPFYVGFDVGGFELGLMPADGDIRPSPSGALVYWGVPNAQQAWDHLLAKGARPHTTISDVGGGILVATVFDLDGNLFGIIENPHFKIK